MPVVTNSNRKSSLVLLAVTISAVILSPTLRAAEGISSMRRSAIVQAVAAARLSVMNIHGRKTLPADADAFVSEGGRQVNGMGTGIVIDDRGYVITNYHVVEGVGRIRVTTADGTTLIAHLVANDPKTDLAIIKIPAEEPIPVIHIGTSEDLMPGETVIAVGNAYGYEHTVTQGIISALHRSVQVSDHQKYHDLIQTDASINPGNSGGPLLNIDGEMIGINVAVRVGAQGIGFAIPINEALEVAADLMSSERVGKLFHGVIGETEYDDRECHFVVHSTRSNSPASKCGLNAGDIIVSADGQDVHRRLDFECAMIGRKAGEEIQLEVLRDGQVESLSLVLTESSRMRSDTTDLAWSQIGLRLSPIPASIFRGYHSRYRGGMKVVAVRSGGPAAQQGIRRGDVLVGMHKWETISDDNISYILGSSEFRTTQPFKFYILREGETLYGHMRASD
jgi:serine protease Do